MCMWVCVCVCGIQYSSIVVIMLLDTINNFFFECLSGYLEQQFWNDFE